MRRPLMPPQLNRRHSEQHREHHHQGAGDLRLPAAAHPARLHDQAQYGQCHANQVHRTHAAQLPYRTGGKGNTLHQSHTRPDTPARPKQTSPCPGIRQTFRYLLAGPPRTSVVCVSYGIVFASLEAKAADLDRQVARSGASRERTPVVPVSWSLPELLYDSVVVLQVPAPDNAAILDPVVVRRPDRNLAAGGRDAQQFGDLLAGRDVPYRHAVAIHDDVLDREGQVGQNTAQVARGPLPLVGAGADGQRRLGRPFRCQYNTSPLADGRALAATLIDGAIARAA